MAYSTEVQVASDILRRVDTRVRVSAPVSASEVYRCVYCWPSLGFAAFFRHIWWAVKLTKDAVTKQFGEMGISVTVLPSWLGNEICFVKLVSQVHVKDNALYRMNLRDKICLLGMKNSVEFMYTNIRSCSIKAVICVIWFIWVHKLPAAGVRKLLLKLNFRLVW